MQRKSFCSSRNLLFVIVLVINPPTLTFAEKPIFILPFASRDFSAAIQNEIPGILEDYIKNNTPYRPEIINFAAARFPESWEDIVNMAQDAEVYGLVPDMLDKIAAGGMALIFMTNFATNEMFEGEFYSEISVSFLLIDLDKSELKNPANIAAAATSALDFEDADIRALNALILQLDEALDMMDFVPKGDFVYESDKNSWVFKKGGNDMVPGDECFINPGGIGLITDKTDDYYMVHIAGRPDISGEGWSLSPRVQANVEINAGVSGYLDLLNYDLGLDISAEIHFRKNFPLFRPFAGISWLYYTRADLPLLVYGGLDYYYLSKYFRFDFSAAIGLAQRFYPLYGISHWGGRFLLHGTFLLSEELRLEAELGFLSLEGIESQTVNGALFGLGLILHL